MNSNNIQNNLLGLDALIVYGVNYKNDIRNDPYLNPETGYRGGEVLESWVEQTSGGGRIIHKIDVAANGRDEYSSEVEYGPDGRIITVDSFKIGEVPTLPYIEEEE